MSIIFDEPEVKDMELYFISYVHYVITGRHYCGKRQIMSWNINESDMQSYRHV